ncbi:hypothetical protein GCM10020000_87470 [Streptomyces olivoverticillatus]
MLSGTGWDDSSPSPAARLTVESVLALAMAVGHEVSAVDIGVPIGAVARCAAHGGELYSDPYSQAGALAHSLGASRWLPAWNLKVACMAAVAQLAVRGVRVRPSSTSVSEFIEALHSGRATADTLAALLAAWST